MCLLVRDLLKMYGNFTKNICKRFYFDMYHAAKKWFCLLKMMKIFHESLTYTCVKRFASLNLPRKLK